MSETLTAMISELRVASWSAGVSSSRPNHSVVKPCSGKAMIVPSLKAKIGRSRIGA
jgi:hypothetical protein